MPPPKSVTPVERPLIWMGSSLKTLSGFPADVRREVGYALDRAQNGQKHSSAKPLTGDHAFSGASVLEIVEDDDGNTYRAVYTTKFAGVIYVLHAFQKKSTQGISTPQHVLDTVKSRLGDAKRDFETRFKIKGSA